MGRPLKIRKYNGATVVDDGFPNDGTTTNGYDDNQPGIVGGINENGDQIRCQAAILVKGLGTISALASSTTVTGTGTHFTTDALTTNSARIWVDDGAGGLTEIGLIDSVTDDVGLELTGNASEDLVDVAWYYTARNDASIVRQKGKSKFLIAGTDSAIQDESIAIGQAYMIAGTGNTNWAALGAGPDAGQYKIFTATANGTGLTTTGWVWPVSVCRLIDDNDPIQPDTMSVAIYDDGNTYYASRLTNKFATDFTDNGTDENPGTVYSATFFNDGGNTNPDPATSNDRVYTMVGIENWC